MKKALKEYKKSLPKGVKFLASNNEDVINYKIDGVMYKAYFSPVVKEVIVTKLKKVAIDMNAKPLGPMFCW